MGARQGHDIRSAPQADIVPPVYVSISLVQPTISEMSIAVSLCSFWCSPNNRSPPAFKVVEALKELIRGQSSCQPLRY